MAGCPEPKGRACPWRPYPVCHGQNGPRSGTPNLPPPHYRPLSSPMVCITVAPDSGEVLYESRAWDKRNMSDSEGWWHGDIISIAAFAERFTLPSRDVHRVIYSNGVVMPTLLPMAGRRAPSKPSGLGLLRATDGNSAVTTTPFPARYPFNASAWQVRGLHRRVCRALRGLHPGSGGRVPKP